ncbi:MAG: PEP/pyruvate-binding domain-containing protein [Phycicoccus sp.]
MCRSCPVVAEEQWAVHPHPPARPAEAGMGEPSPYVVWLDAFTEADRGRLGGKNASLGSMIAAGLPVPPGFAVTTDAYERLWADPDLAGVVRGALSSADADDPHRLRAVSAVIRSAIESHSVPDDVERAIRAAYEAFSAHCGTDAVGVAIRSSATAEDQPDASFAGQQDTFLWVHGADAVVEHVRRCWSSVYTDRAIAYRRAMGYDDHGVSMSVGVQKMVDPRASGVAFTLNPTTGDRSQVAIDASWGLGEAVVSGEVTPDNFVVDKVLRAVVGRTVSDKHVEYRRGADGVAAHPVDDARRSVPCLTDDEICAVAAMARRAEKHYGRPQDVEWALDDDLPDGENVILLQARPETVWSKAPRASVTDGDYDPMTSIVSTLTAPIRHT